MKLNLLRIGIVGCWMLSSCGQDPSLTVQKIGKIYQSKQYDRRFDGTYLEIKRFSNVKFPKTSDTVSTVGYGIYPGEKTPRETSNTFSTAPGEQLQFTFG